MYNRVAHLPVAVEPIPREGRSRFLLAMLENGAQLGEIISGEMLLTLMQKVGTRNGRRRGERKTRKTGD